MGQRYEIRLSGSGGQGLILAGVILAEAAAIYDGKNTIQSQSYGPEARGGASKADVIISDQAIDYPKATEIDALLALTQKACAEYCHDVKKGGFLLVDSELVTEVPNGNYKVYRLPILRIAAQEVGKSMVANIVALGAIVELTKIVSEKAIEAAVLARVPEGTGDLNKMALKAGMEGARKLKEAGGLG